MQKRKLDFERGLQISKQFQTRSSEEETYLYECIRLAIDICQDSKHPLQKEAMDFISTIYYPLIKKVANKTLKLVQKTALGDMTTFSYEDILQETYLMFFLLLKQYDSTIASFSYYINKTLFKRMKHWITKELKQVTQSSIGEYLNVVDPRFSSHGNTEHYLHAMIIINDYIEFMSKKAELAYPHSTAAMVCADFFLGCKTCSQIAKERNISYHAVYDMINKYKRHIMTFFNSHALFDSLITSTGII